MLKGVILASKCMANYLANWYIYTPNRFGGRSGARVIQAFAFICVGSESNLDECTLTGAHCDVSQGSDFIAISCQE